MDTFLAALEILMWADIASVAFFALICWTDRRWYAKHPGAEEYFARVDLELEAQGL